MFGRIFWQCLHVTTVQLVDLHVTTVQTVQSNAQTKGACCLRMFCSSNHPNMEAKCFLSIRKCTGPKIWGPKKTKCWCIKHNSNNIQTNIVVEPCHCTSCGPQLTVTIFLSHWFPEIALQGHCSSTLQNVNIVVFWCNHFWPEFHFLSKPILRAVSLSKSHPDCHLVLSQKLDCRTFSPKLWTCLFFPFSHCLNFAANGNATDFAQFPAWLCFSLAQGWFEWFVSACGAFQLWLLGDHFFHNHNVVLGHLSLVQSNFWLLPLNVHTNAFFSFPTPNTVIVHLLVAGNSKACTSTFSTYY